MSVANKMLAFSFHNPCCGLNNQTSMKVLRKLAEFQGWETFVFKGLDDPRIPKLNEVIVAVPLFDGPAVRWEKRSLATGLGIPGWAKAFAGGTSHGVVVSPNGSADVVARGVDRCFSSLVSSGVGRSSRNPATIKRDLRGGGWLRTHRQ